MSALSDYQRVCLSVFSSFRLLVWMSVCSSASLYALPFFYSFVRSSVCLAIHPSAWVYICRSHSDFDSHPNTCFKSRSGSIRQPTAFGVQLLRISLSNISEEGYENNNNNHTTTTRTSATARWRVLWLYLSISILASFSFSDYCWTKYKSCQNSPLVHSHADKWLEWGKQW